MKSYKENKRYQELRIIMTAWHSPKRDIELIRFIAQRLDDLEKDFELCKSIDIVIDSFKELEIDKLHRFCNKVRMYLKREYYYLFIN